MHGGPAVSKERSLKMLILSELGQRSMNDLDYSYRFTYLFSLLCKPALTTIVSEKKSVVLTFSHTKSQGTKLDLAIKCFKVKQGSLFEQTW